MNTSTADREITITRLLDAPRELVFEAWTKPEHISRWWGPNGFSATTKEMTVKPGSRWLFTLNGPDNMSFPSRIQYIEVVKPEKLVYEHGYDVEDDPQRFLVTVTFENAAGKTKLTMHTIFRTKEQLEMVKSFGAIEKGNETIDHLVAYLKEMSL